MGGLSRGGGDVYKRGGVFCNSVGDAPSTGGDPHNTVGDLPKTMGDLPNTVGDLPNTLWGTLPTMWVAFLPLCPSSLYMAASSYTTRTPPTTQSDLFMTISYTSNTI